MSSDAIIIAVFSGIGMLVTAAATAWITLRKSRAETAKAEEEIERKKRNGVLEEWRSITDRLQVTIKEQDAEVKALRAEVIKLYAEMAALRVQISDREKERLEQRNDIRTLEKRVTDLHKPENMVESIVPKIIDAIGTAHVPVPVTIIPADEPLPVTETKREDKSEP